MFCEHANDVHRFQMIWRAHAGIKCIIRGDQLRCTFSNVTSHGNVGIDHEIGSFKLSASYVGTRSPLAAYFANGTEERSGFAPYTQFTRLAGPSEDSVRIGDELGAHPVITRCKRA